MNENIFKKSKKKKLVELLDKYIIFARVME